MKHGRLTYRYARQLNGKGRFGSVTIEIVRTNSKSAVTDACEWQTFRQEHKHFVESDDLRLWKQSAINAAEEVINRFFLPDNIELVLVDLNGLDVDTRPSHIGVAMVMGIFDYCELPLDQNDLQLLDKFVENENEIGGLPDYSELRLSSHARK